MGKYRPNGDGSWVKDKKKDRDYRERHYPDEYPSNTTPSSPKPKVIAATPAALPTTQYDLYALTPTDIWFIDQTGTLNEFFSSPIWEGQTEALITLLGKLDPTMADKILAICPSAAELISPPTTTIQADSAFGLPLLNLVAPKQK